MPKALGRVADFSVQVPKWIALLCRGEDTPSIKPPENVPSHPENCKLPTEFGALKPNLIMLKDNKAFVLDVTVAWEGGRPLNLINKGNKKNSPKRRAAEELKTVPQIYHEEASSASADLETAGNGRKNFPDCNHEAATKKKAKMLLATAFSCFMMCMLPGNYLAAILRVQLPLWNAYNVNIRMYNDLEVWHFKRNRFAGKRHQLLSAAAVADRRETLNQQVTSGRVTANDLYIKNKKYEQLQQRITAWTAEYDGGTCTVEQFLKAVAYLVLEAENY
ncbi:hypothetical protein T4E_4836 [Trichinella pseudospiralis]|uniref:Uncharacterized protein n=1 Tax=Trichinella pseudospiralis TaxID=6337 RepID=A0A0V0YJ25_TRIPS|nr:hypothetical protein T4E_4836 [Trichinella pseudospiralis]